MSRSSNREVQEMIDQRNLYRAKLLDCILHEPKMFEYILSQMEKDKVLDDKFKETVLESDFVKRKLYVTLKWGASIYDLYMNNQKELDLERIEYYKDYVEKVGPYNFNSDMVNELIEEVRNDNIMSELCKTAITQALMITPMAYI